MADQSPARPNVLSGLLTGQGAAAPSAPTPTPPAPASPPTAAEPAIPTEGPTAVLDLAPGILPAGIVQPQPEYLILEWVADSRVHRPRTREYYSSLAVIVLLVSLILFFAGQTLLIFVVLAFLFVTYVLASTRPMPVVNQLSTYGIRYQGKLYYWNQLGRFWVRDNHGIAEIHIEAPTFIGNELILLTANSQSPQPVSADDIVSVLRLYLINEVPPLGQIDRWVRWLEEKFPLESRAKKV